MPYYLSLDLFVDSSDNLLGKGGDGKKLKGNTSKKVKKS